MIYVGSLNSHQQVYLENKGNQTLITLVSSSKGQQQSQSSSFETGNWTTPPTLFHNDGSFLLRIDSISGQHFIQLQTSGLNSLTTAPSLRNADVIPLQKESARSRPSLDSLEFATMEPMEPMKPMKMGNMSMGIKPMEMRMGDMYMKMPDNSAKQSSSGSGKNFCTQCGNLVKASDRFCGNCGHKLED